MLLRVCPLIAVARSATSALPVISVPYEMFATPLAFTPWNANVCELCGVPTSMSYASSPCNPTLKAGFVVVPKVNVNMLLEAATPPVA